MAEETPPRTRRRRASVVAEEAPVNEVEEQEEYNFAADLEIDKHLLDEEFLYHPQVFMKWAKLSADANREMQRCHENLKTVRSELTLLCHRTPEVMGEKVKASAPTVEAYYRTHPDYIKAKNAWIDAEHNANLLANAVSAFHARKLSLEKLVALHGQEYYSSPVVPRDAPEMVERVQAIQQKSVKSRIREKMNRD